LNFLTEVLLQNPLLYIFEKHIVIILLTSFRKSILLIVGLFINKIFQFIKENGWRSYKICYM